MTTIHAQILSYRSPQRYAVRRTLQAALSDLRRETPDVELEIHEVSEVADILKVTQVLIQPCLVLNGRLVCNGRFPKKDEVVRWLKSTLNDPAQK